MNRINADVYFFFLEEQQPHDKWWCKVSSLLINCTFVLPPTSERKKHFFFKFVVSGFIVGFMFFLSGKWSALLVLSFFFIVGFIMYSIFVNHLKHH
jgi:uncharacterized membrane protein